MNHSFGAGALIRSVTVAACLLAWPGTALSQDYPVRRGEAFRYQARLALEPSEREGVRATNFVRVSEREGVRAKTESHDLPTSALTISRIVYAATFDR